MRKIALLLVLCMLFGLCACSSQPEDLNEPSSRQETETSQETESSGELTADSILGTWTLELIMPDGEENITRQIRAESDYKMYFIEEDGSEEEFKWELGNKSNLTLFNYSTDAYFSDWGLTNIVPFCIIAFVSRES